MLCYVSQKDEKSGSTPDGPCMFLRIRIFLNPDCMSHLSHWSENWPIREGPPNLSVRVVPLSVSESRGNCPGLITASICACAVARL